MRALTLAVTVCLLGCPGPSSTDGGSGGGAAGGSTGGSTGGSGGGGGGSGGATGGSGGSTGGGTASDAGTDAGTPYDAGTLGVDALCNQYFDAFCEYYTRCGFTESKVGCLGVVDNRSNPWFAATCLLEERAAIDAGRLAFDERAAAACLYKLRTGVPCAPNAAPSYAPECDAILRGLVTSGPCARSSECTPGNYCDASLAMCPGTCRPRKGAGATAASDEECQPGYYVYDGQCRLYALTGLSCAPVGSSSTPQQCRPGEAKCTANTCVALRQEGYPCMDDSDCGFPLRCAGGNCRHGVGLGQTCSYGFTGAPAALCRLDLACSNGVNPDGGVCRPLGGVGSGCFSLFECAANLTCRGVIFGTTEIDAGTCVAPALNARCSSIADCDLETAFCDADAGQCRPRRAPGSMGSCTTQDQCTPPDFCVAGSCRKPYCVP